MIKKTINGKRHNIEFVGISAKKDIDIAIGFFEKEKQNIEITKVQWQSGVYYQNYFGKDEDKEIRAALFIYETKKRTYIKKILYWNKRVKKELAK